jgi:hypothetical protein
MWELTLSGAIGKDDLRPEQLHVELTIKQLMSKASCNGAFLNHM